MYVIVSRIDKSLLSFSVLLTGGRDIGRKIVPDESISRIINITHGLYQRTSIPFRRDIDSVDHFDKGIGVKGALSERLGLFETWENWEYRNSLGTWICWMAEGANIWSEFERTLDGLNDITLPFKL